MFAVIFLIFMLGNKIRHICVCLGVLCCRIVTTLSGKVGFQIQYQLTFCLWVMTFDPTVADKVSRCVLSILCTLLFPAVQVIICSETNIVLLI